MSLHVYFTRQPRYRIQQGNKRISFMHLHPLQLFCFLDDYLQPKEFRHDTRSTAS